MMPELEEQKTLESGYVTLEDLRRHGNIPPDEVLESKAVPIFDCIEEIPCTPCRDACPTGAVVMPTMIDKPRVNWAACTGCTLCAQACPGLAITVVNVPFGKRVLKDPAKALVSIPYEMLPVPKKGERVALFDRGHKYLGEGEVFSVIRSHRYGTVLVNVIVPKEIALKVKFVGVVHNE